jgi:PEP-CTERM motif
MRKLALAVFILSLAAAPAVFADDYQFYLNTDHYGDVLPPANSVLVDVNLNLGTEIATITATGENGYDLYSFFVNVDGAFTRSPSGSYASGTLDSMGGFSAYVSGGTNPTETITIQGTVGEWADAMAVLTPNGYHSNYPNDPAGFEAAAQVLMPGGDKYDVAGPSVPEPTSLILLGTLMCGIAFVFRKKLA